MTRVLVAGSRVMSERTVVETRPLVAALAAAGVDAATAPWDDDTVDWAGADLVVVRTTWDYTERLAEFLAWAGRVAAATRLENPVEVIRWNSHKAYLVELADAGVPVVPTRLVRRGDPDPSAALAATGPGPLVVKPAVGAGGRGAHRGSAVELADPLAALCAAGDALVQPAVPGIDRDGEVSLVYLGGRCSHAVRKLPAAGGFLVHERHGGRIEDHEPTARELAVAEAALACSPAPVPAGRVDLVRIDGEPVVMELELIEPELFLRRAPAAAGALATALITSGQGPER